jgi:hypothetical protein
MSELSKLHVAPSAGIIRCATYINAFGLPEHLKERYDQILRRALQLVHAQHAFVGSKERAKLPREDDSNARH